MGLFSKETKCQPLEKIIAFLQSAEHRAVAALEHPTAAYYDLKMAEGRDIPDAYRYALAVAKLAARFVKFLKRSPHKINTGDKLVVGEAKNARRVIAALRAEAGAALEKGKPEKENLVKKLATTIAALEKFNSLIHVCDFCKH